MRADFPPPSHRAGSASVPMHRAHKMLVDDDRSAPDSRRLDVTTVGTGRVPLVRTNTRRRVLAGTMQYCCVRSACALTGTGSASSSVVLPQAAG